MIITNISILSLDLQRLREHATTMFEYEGETLSTIQGSTPDSTGMKIRAKIYIHPQRACRYSMQVTIVYFFMLLLLIQNIDLNFFNLAFSFALVFGMGH